MRSLPLEVIQLKFDTVVCLTRPVTDHPVTYDAGHKSHSASKTQQEHEYCDDRHLPDRKIVVRMSMDKATTNATQFNAVWAHRALYQHSPYAKFLQNFKTGDKDFSAAFLYLLLTNCSYLNNASLLALANLKTAGEEGRAVPPVATTPLFRLK